MSREKKVRIRGIEFTFQELAVVEELKQGATYWEIAEKLSLSEKTVAYYVKFLKGKTNTSSREELISFFDADRDSDKPLKNSSNIAVNEKAWMIWLTVLSTTITGAMMYYLTQEGNRPITNVMKFTDNFLNRPYIEQQIIEKLKKQKGIKVVVICGTGGAGKSTISRKVLSSMKGNVKFEINAETQETLYNSFIELADYVSTTAEYKKELDVIRDLRNPEYRKKSLVRFVSGLLRQLGNWILLLDNVGTFEDIKDYFPVEEVWGHGVVLITTRNQSLEESNFIKRDWIINIGKLREQEKKELFTSIVYGCKFENLLEDDQESVEQFLTLESLRK